MHHTPYGSPRSRTHDTDQSSRAYTEIPPTKISQVTLFFSVFRRPIGLIVILRWTHHRVYALDEHEDRLHLRYSSPLVALFDISQMHLSRLQANNHISAARIETREMRVRYITVRHHAAMVDNPFLRHLRHNIYQLIDKSIAVTIITSSHLLDVIRVPRPSYFVDDRCCGFACTLVFFNGSAMADR